MPHPSPDSDMEDGGNVQRVIGIAVDSSEDSTVAVNWAVQNHLRPDDSVILVYVRPTSVFTTSKASDQAKPLVEANIPFNIHTVKQRPYLEVNKLGLTMLITALHGSEFEKCECPLVLLRFQKRCIRGLGKRQKVEEEDLEYKDRKGKKMRENDVARVSDVRDGESKLIIVTASQLLVWDLNRPRDETSTRPCDEPALSQAIDFVSNNLPEFMSVMRLGKNEFYMVGGILACEKFDPYCKTTFSTTKKVKSIYKLNMYNNNWSLNPAKELNEPIAPKYEPRVEVANGKVYVLQQPICRDAIPEAPFEVYNIASNVWEKLPTIPTRKTWSRADRAIVKSGVHSASLLVGCRLYIVFGKRSGKRNEEKIFGCFNTKKCMWEDKNGIRLQKCFEKVIFPFPNMGTCVSRIDDLDDGLNIILYRLHKRTLAYIIDDSGYLLCYQIVDDLSVDHYDDEYEDEDYGESLVDLNGGGRMCLVISEYHDGVYAIILQRFELRLRDEGKEEVRKLRAIASARGLSGDNPVQMKFLTVGNITKQRCTHTEKEVFIDGGSAFFL